MRPRLPPILALGVVGTIAPGALAQQDAPPSQQPSTAPQSPSANQATESDAAPSVPESGFELGARVGYSFALGDLSNLLQGAMPLWLDAGYRLNRQITLGVYGRFGVGFPAGALTGATAYLIGFGAEGQYHLAPLKSLDPWVGLVAGYEIATLSYSGASTSLSGIDFANLQLGVDYKAGFGPFLSFAVGQYSSNGQSSTHEWLTLGVRGTYDW